MRLIALYAVLAATSTLSLCERRHPDACKEAGVSPRCDEGLVCKKDWCVPGCADNAGCTDPKLPLCSDSVCVGCMENRQCLSSYPAAPYCQGGSCVACNGNSSCPSALKPVCDAKAFECRSCRRHDECSSGVCAKDDLLANLTGNLAIPAGSCVGPERVLVVNANSCAGPVLCNAREALDKVSPQRPYILLKNGQGMMFTNLVVPGNNLSGLKVVHLIGPMADEAPTRVDTRPVTLGGALSRGLAVEPGHRVVLEGLVIEGGVTGVECTGAGEPAATELRLVRVVIGNSETAVKASGCHLRVEDSWIGAGFDPVFRGMLGNRLALKLTNSEFVLQNSVLFRNGLLGSFGGIDLFYDPMWKGARSVIVNSTIAYHSAPAASGAVSLECNSSVADRLTIFNTFFYNDALQWQMQPTRHIAATCQPQYGPLATNDEGLARDAAPGLLVKGEGEAGFLDAKAGNLRLSDAAPASVATGGVAAFKSGAVELPAPDRDLEGTLRGRRQMGRVSIGSFEAPAGAGP